MTLTQANSILAQIDYERAADLIRDMTAELKRDNDDADYVNGLREELRGHERRMAEAVALRDSTAAGTQRAIANEKYMECLALVIQTKRRIAEALQGCE